MKGKCISFLFILIILMSGCNIGESPKENIVEIYTIALDSMMEKDEGLNSNMEYIAIDMSNFDEVNEKEKEDIRNYFQANYKVKVMDATLDELKEKGYYNPDAMALDGVLLRFEKIDYKFNKNVKFEGSKFRSGKGAIGLEITVYYIGGKWQIKESKATWIS